MKKIFYTSLLFFMLPAMAEVCSDGGHPSSVNPNYCCKGPYTPSYYGGIEEYRAFSPHLCGCPDGGKLSADGHHCCKNGYQYYDGDYSNWGKFNLSNAGYSTINANVCGCPDDEAKIIDGYCCNNGWIDSWYNPRICGCPDGGKMNLKDDRCVKDGYSYNPHIKEYTIVSAEDYGCPKGSKEVKNICCKSGFSYDNDAYTWSKVDGRCGCPKGGHPTALKQHMEEVPCCKNNLMWNEKTQEYDLKNDYFCNPSAYNLTDSQKKSMEKNPEEFFVWWEKHKYIASEKGEKYVYLRNFSRGESNLSDTHRECPEGTEEKEGVCCENGFVFNSQMNKYVRDGRCGCSDGSSRSKWGPMLLELGMPDMIDGIKSLCCKNGKAVEGKIEVRDDIFCKSVPRNKQKAAKMLYSDFMKLFQFLGW